MTPHSSKEQTPPLSRLQPHDFLPNPHGPTPAPCSPYGRMTQPHVSAITADATSDRGKLKMHFQCPLLELPHLSHRCPLHWGSEHVEAKQHIWLLFSVAGAFFLLCCSRIRDYYSRGFLWGAYLNLLKRLSHLAPVTSWHIAGAFSRFRVRDGTSKSPEEMKESSPTVQAERRYGRLTVTPRFEPMSCVQVFFIKPLYVDL